MKAISIAIRRPVRTDSFAGSKKRVVLSGESENIIWAERQENVGYVSRTRNGSVLFISLLTHLKAK